MALDINNYETALQQGALIQTKNLASGSITAAKLASSSVTGVKLSTTVNYAQIAVGVTTSAGVATNVFGSATAPVAGTVTGFFVANQSTTVGSITLWGTTAGTIATVILASGTIGLIAGTNVLNASIAAGDTVTVTPAAGSGTAYVTFVTAS